MGSKRDIPTQTTDNHTLYPGGKPSRDPSPLARMTASLERAKHKMQEKTRRVTENPKTKAKKYSETEQEQNFDRDRTLDPRVREGEQKERERRQEGDRSKNGRLLSNVEMSETERDVVEGRRKGNTFPKMKKGDRDPELEEERRQRRGPQRGETDEGTTGRETFREKEKIWIAVQEEGTFPRQRRVETERTRRRERRKFSGDDLQDRTGETIDLRHMTDKEAARKRERMRLEMNEKEARMNSPQRRTGSEMYTERKVRGPRKDGRSEWEINEREVRREAKRDREREEMMIYQSRNIGGYRGKAPREKDQDRQRYRGTDVDRYMGRQEERPREADRRPARQVDGERGDRRGDDRYTKEKRHRERNERQEDANGGRDSRSTSEFIPRARPPARDGGEQCSEEDSEKYRQNRDNCRVRDRRREGAGESEETIQRQRDLEGTADRRQKHQKRNDRKERDGGQTMSRDSEQRKMWLEPQRGKDSKTEDRGTYRRQEEGEREEEKFTKDSEGVSVDDEESGREEVGGNENWKGSGSEEGSDSDRTLPSEGGGGGDEEDEREYYRDHEEEFNDCQEDEDPTAASLKSSEGEEREKELDSKNEEVTRKAARRRQKNSKYDFCQSKNTELSLPEDDEMGGAEIDEPNLGKNSQSSEDDTYAYQDDHDMEERDRRYGASKELQDDDLGEEVRHLYVKRGAMTRDSQTDRLLQRWREKNEVAQNNSFPGARTLDTFEQIPHFVEDLNIESMSPEEMEAVRLKMSRAWSISQEHKRRTQAPHLKWATSVVREILGHSDEQAADEPNGASPEDQEVNGFNPCKQQDMIPQRSFDLPTFTLTKDNRRFDLDMEEDDPGEFQGMGQNPAHTNAEQVTATHVATQAHTQTDTQSHTGRKEDQTTEPSCQAQVEKADLGTLRETDKEKHRKEEKEIYLTATTSTLCKPNSCPTLNSESESDLLTPPTEGESQEVKDEKSQNVKEGQTEERDTEVEKMIGETEEETREGGMAAQKKTVTLTHSRSFLDMGPEVRLRRLGIRIPTKRRNGEGENVEDVGKDGRTSVFSPEDPCSKSLAETDLRLLLDRKGRQQKNSFFNDLQLYQQYSEEAQNSEILRQSRSDVLSVSEDSSVSPLPSPPPARRPLPALPPALHPHSLSHTGSVTSAKDLPLPELPNCRPSSPRLSISLTQPSLLWRDLPAVRNDPELEEMKEDQRRLQEVRFEVVTSEASYCRSLDIVVKHFVKSKELEGLLTTQDKNWLFSRLTDVRAISRSFLTKLEERVESDIMHFTVCDIIVQQCQGFRNVYVPYLTNQSYQDATFQKLMNGNPGFKRAVEVLERSPVCHRLPLRSFLVLPFQRITRLKLLVQNIVKRTTPGTEEATHAIKALKLLEKMIQESNDSISRMKNIESLVTLNSKVDFECKTLPLVRQSRRMVREGLVTQLMEFSEKDSEKSIYLHLFNDYLLISTQKEGGRFTVIDYCPVENLKAVDCRVKLLSLEKNVFRLHTSADKPLLLRTETQSDKLRWMSAISGPHGETDLGAAQDLPQMQCIRSFVAQQPDELYLEKADVILVHQESSDNWVDGTRLSDLHRGWVPKSHLEVITNASARKRNLSDALKVTTATATV